MAVVLQHSDTVTGARRNIPGGPCLSEDGWRQAETLADRVANLPITHLLAAPTLACRQTLLPSAALKRRMVEPTDPLNTQDGAEQLCQQWAAPGLETAALCVTPIVLTKLLTALYDRRDVDLDLPERFSLAASTALLVTQHGHGRLLLHRLPEQPSLQRTLGPLRTAEAGLEPADAALVRLASQREQLGVRLAEMRGQLVVSQHAWRQLSKQLQHESQQLVVQAQILVQRVDAATRMLGRLQQPPTAGGPTGRQSPSDDSLDKQLADVQYRSAVLAEYVERWLVVLDGHQTAVNIEQVAHTATAAALLAEHTGEEAPNPVWPPASRPADAAIVVRELADQARLRHPQQAITVQLDGELLVAAPVGGIAEILGPLLDHACAAVGSGVLVRVQATARDLLVVLAVEVTDARRATAHATPGALSPVAADWPRRGDLYLDAARRFACQHGSPLLAAMAASGAGERFELRLQRAQPGTAATRS